MRHVKRIAIASGIVVVLLVLSFVFGTKSSESRDDRKIAAELVELHRQWQTNPDIPALYESLTNLPFHKGGVLVGRGSISRRHAVFGIGWEEYYFINQPRPVTNASEWTLYHAWYWYRPRGGGKEELATRKLVTIKTD